MELCDDINSIIKFKHLKYIKIFTKDHCEDGKRFRFKIKLIYITEMKHPKGYHN